MSAETKPPRGLLPESRKRWDDLHAANSFSAHEEIACTRWLVLEDRGEKLWDEGKVDEAIKCWTLATRWFKALKFASDATPRRPGRPGDVEWSGPRKLGRRAS